MSGTAGCTSTTPQYIETAPSGLWVAQTPSDTEAEGVTYQHRAWDCGLFNKRVGTYYMDNGLVSQPGDDRSVQRDESVLNYTMRSGSRFDQTKFRLSFNNLFNQSNITGITPTGAVPTQTIVANGVTYTDQFNTAGQTPVLGGDNVGILAGRSITLTVSSG